MIKYDYIIVGAGLFGAVFAHEATKMGKKCLVLEKRDHIGGNCYTENVDGIVVHKYGPHIFHTSKKEVWDYVNSFEEMTPFINSPLANFRGKLYHLPFNMNTFYELWGVTTPKKAMEKIASQIIHYNNPQNIKEQALSLVGSDIYEKLIEGYTEKQWGKSAEKLPADIIKRLPLRFTFNNNYFNDKYQGVCDYTKLISAMLKGIEVRLNTDFLVDKTSYENIGEKVVYTGAIDEYFGYSCGCLTYRSLEFETTKLDMDNYQGNAVINFTESSIPYTRVIEHKHFMEGSKSATTIITREYPKEWSVGKERYYPVNDMANTILYSKYRRLADQQNKVIFGGRLGLYQYLNMDAVIEESLKSVTKNIK